MLSYSVQRGGTPLRHLIQRASSCPPWNLGVSVTMESVRSLSNNANWNRRRGGFRPRRRPDRSYRPIKPGAKKIIDPSPGNDHKFFDLGKPTENPIDEYDANFGKLGGEFLRHFRKQREAAYQNKQGYYDKVEEDLRMIDYYLSESGSLEDMVGQRRALAKDFNTEQERSEYLAWLDRLESEDRRSNMRLDPPDPVGETENLFSRYGEDDEEDEVDRDPESYLDPNQLAHGIWSEQLISVDRSVKLWRGGRLESYRALVIGGNMNGCGGFGVGKSTEAMVAVKKAVRICKRNIFFVDRYQGNGLTRDLVGKQNSCKLIIRANDTGLRGNELAREVLKRFGITNASAKAFGNRGVYNVVQATFKALMTHESLEDIALKRGKRIVSLDRAMRLQI
jgi:small subunit ribosomal protein S5